MKSRMIWLCAAVVGLVAVTFAARNVRQRAERAVWEKRMTNLRQISSGASGNAALAKLFINPTKVEAYRMQTPSGAAPAPVIGKVDGFDYTAKRVGLSKEFSARLGALVLAPDTYTGLAKLCIFEPSAGFRVSQGDKWANVVICLGCRQLVVVEPQAPWNSKGAFEARFRFSGEFDYRRGEFLALAREAFPAVTTLK